jgi:hypothetical protein
LQERGELSSGDRRPTRFRQTEEQLRPPVPSPGVFTQCGVRRRCVMAARVVAPSEPRRSAQPRRKARERTAAKDAQPRAAWSIIGRPRRAIGSSIVRPAGAKQATRCRSGAVAEIGRALLVSIISADTSFQSPIQDNRHPAPPSTPRSSGRELEVLSAGKVCIVVHLRDGLETATASMTVPPTMVVCGTCTAAAPFTLVRQPASSTHCVVSSASVQRRWIFAAEALDLGLQVGGHRAGASGSTRRAMA